MAGSTPSKLSEAPHQTQSGSSNQDPSQSKENPSPGLQDQPSIPVSPGRSIFLTSLPSEGEQLARLGSLKLTPESKIHPQVHTDREDKEIGGDDGGNNGRVDAAEEVLVRIPDTMVHLIDEQGSALLASGEFSLVRLVQNSTALAVFARVGDDFQWPVAKDAPTAKIDPAHYFFTLRAADEEEQEDQSQRETLPSLHLPEDTLSYGVTFRVQGNEEALKELDNLLEQYSLFSTPTIVQADANRREAVVAGTGENAAGTGTGKDAAPPSDAGQLPGKVVAAELVAGDGTPPTHESSSAYWTTMAPNVQDYNSSLAKAIASGTGQVIRCILWCSEATVASLTKGGTFVKGQLKPGHSDAEVSPQTMKNIRRAKKISTLSQQTANAILSGVVKTIGFFTSPLINSRAGQKFFSLLPGEVALASLDAFGKLFDAVEVAGKNVLSATSDVTADVVSHRYGGQAAELTHEGLSAMGYAAGTVWAISKFRNALNPKNIIKPSNLMKSAARATYKEMDKK